MTFTAAAMQWLARQSHALCSILAFIVVLIAAGCSPIESGSARPPTSAAPPQRNVWAAREVPSSEIAAIETAMRRHLVLSGLSPEQIEEKKKGLTKEQVQQIEEGICTRLPDDLKALFAIYLTDGNFIGGSIGFFDKPEQIIKQWKQRVEMEYNIVPIISSRSAAPLSYDPKGYLQPTAPNAFHIPIAKDSHVDTIYLDIRNGQVVEESNHTLFKLADSLAEFLNNIADREEARIKEKATREQDGSNGN